MFTERLKQAVGATSLRGLALQIGISPSALGQYVSGKSEPTRPVLQKISEATGVCLAWLVSGEGPMRPDLQPSAVDDGAFSMVPHFDIQASAGSGAVVDAELIKEKIAFQTKWLRDMGLDPKELNVISVRGDSMEPSLSDGDIILIDKREIDPRSGGVYVLNYDGSLLVKRLQPLLNGGFKIISDNPRYEPETVTDDKMQHLRIIGRVIWKGGLIA